MTTLFLLALSGLITFVVVVFLHEKKQEIACYFKGHTWGEWTKMYVGHNDGNNPSYELWRKCERCNEHEEKSYE